MTTTPEERARAVAVALRGGAHQRPMPIVASESQIALIAQSIREAEDAAIERAALIVQTKTAMTATTFEQAGEMLRDRNGDEHFLGTTSVNELIERKASAIRSLKSKD